MTHLSLSLIVQEPNFLSRGDCPSLHIRTAPTEVHWTMLIERRHACRAMRYSTLTLSGWPNAACELRAIQLRVVSQLDGLFVFRVGRSRDKTVTERHFGMV